MAIQCKYCGTELAKDDARFCNNCGMLVPSHPFSPQSLSALKSDSRFPFASPAEGLKEGHKRVLREQVAELPPARPKQEDHPKQDRLSDEYATLAEDPVEVEKPDANELSQKEKGPQEKLPETPKPGAQQNTPTPSRVAYKQMTPLVSPRQMPGVRRKISGPIQSSPAWPAPVTHVSAKESAVPEKERSAEQDENAPIQEKREFHVGVWEDEEMRELTDEERQSIESMPTRSVVAMPVEDAPTQEVAVPVEDEPTQEVAMPVEDAPTQEVMTPVEDAPTQEVATPVEDAPTQEVMTPAENQLPVQGLAVEQLPASPFLSVPSSQTAAQERLAEDWRVQSRVNSRPADPSIVPVQSNMAPFVPSSGYQPVNVPGMSMRENEVAASLPPPRRSRRRWPIVVLVVLLLVVLVAGGVGAVMILSPQSSGDAMIQPQVSFNNAQLGVSLLYPNGWIEQVEANKSTAHFYANNHVGQVDVIVATGSGGAKQAVQQQAVKMGMSGTKDGATLNFAGASWQQLQGTLQQSGASYTDMLLATTHGSKLFMIVQQAPQSNYADWEKEFFMPLRTSFKFL